MKSPTKRVCGSSACETVSSDHISRGRLSGMAQGLKLMQDGSTKRLIFRRRRVSVSQLFVGWVVLFLVLMLAPYCELFAATFEKSVNVSIPDRYDVGDITLHQYNSPVYCGKWANSADNAIKAMLGTPPYRPDSRTGLKVGILFRASLAVSFSSMNFYFYHSPPPVLPLYLRNKHFLI